MNTASTTINWEGELLMDDQQGKLVLIAHKSFKADPELVYIVDFLNKTLKDKHIMFGLTKDRDKEEMTINIYEF
ncbi:MAG: YpmA family protein [Syntrophomonadaceae bacterium]|jgi:hypothetical protein